MFVACVCHIFKRYHHHPNRTQIRGMIYTCDECLKGPLRFKRYRCQTCPEFDLCTVCYRSNKHRNEGHKFTACEIEEADEEENSLVAKQRAFDAEEEALSSLMFQQRQRKSTSVDAVSKMDDLLNRIQLKIPTCRISSALSVQFLDLFEQTSQALKESKSKKLRVMEQIMARTALALVGTRVNKRSASTLTLSAPEPELVHTVTKGLLSQLLIFNQSVGERTDAVRKLVEQTEKTDFARVYFQILDALELCTREQSKAAASAIEALEELKEALGFDDIERQGKSKPKKPRKNTSTAEDVVEKPIEADKRPRFAVVENALPLESPLDIINRVNLFIAESSVEADQFRLIIAELKEEVNDAHARIDILVHILRESVGAPLQHVLAKLTPL